MLLWHNRSTSMFGCGAGPGNLWCSNGPWTRETTRCLGIHSFWGGFPWFPHAFHRLGLLIGTCRIRRTFRYPPWSAASAHDLRFMPLALAYLININQQYQTWFSHFAAGWHARPIRFHQILSDFMSWIFVNPSQTLGWTPGDSMGFDSYPNRIRVAMMKSHRESCLSRRAQIGQCWKSSICHNRNPTWRCHLAIEHGYGKSAVIWAILVNFHSYIKLPECR